MNDSSHHLLDGLRPFTRYLSLSAASTITTKNQYVPTRSITTDSSISDWGIDSEDLRSLGSPTLVNMDYSYASMDEDTTVTYDSLMKKSSERYNHWVLPSRKIFGNNTQQSSQDTSVPLLYFSLTERFRKIDGESAAFQDELRYVIVTSQLLDETILVSKYYNKKKSSTSKLTNVNSKIRTGLGDFITLKTTFRFCPNEGQSKLISCMLFLQFLFKNHSIFTKFDVKVILIVVGASLFKVLQLRLAKVKIFQYSLLKELKELIKMYQKLDLTLQRLITRYKELTIFSEINKETDTGRRKGKHTSPEPLWSLINTSISVLTDSIISDIANFLPYTNGLELENYCGIYNVSLHELGFLLQDMKPFYLDTIGSIDEIITKLRKFQYLRRFYLCCLLAMNTDSSKSTETSDFLSKILRLLQVAETDNVCSVSHKWHILSQNLKKSRKLCDSLSILLNEYKDSNPDDTSEKWKELRFHHGIKPRTSELFELLKELQTELIVFDQNQSIEAQISNLKQIGDLIESIKGTHQRELTLLEASLDRKQFNLTPSSTNRKSPSERKKRYSLPTGIQTQFSSQRSVSLTSPALSDSHSPNSHKRLSSGLSVPLLTVMEDEESQQRRTVSYDDNYLNIAPNYNESPSYPSTNDLINERDLLSNDDSVIITSNSEDKSSDNVLSEKDLKSILESKFGHITSTPKSYKSDNVRDIEESNREVPLKYQTAGKHESEHESDSFIKELNFALAAKTT